MKYLRREMEMMVDGELKTVKVIPFGHDVFEHKCCICGEEFEGYGNNPWPVMEDGRCCDDCNHDYVVPARLGQIARERMKSQAS